MPWYEVREGFRFGSQKQYGPGDRLELSEEEAAGFRDKLRRVAVPEPAPVVEVTPEGEGAPAADGQAEPASDASLPDGEMKPKVKRPTVKKATE